MITNKCPKCGNRHTLCVKAMNYKETQFTHGYFSGAGFGVGSGGGGLGGGGGTIHATPQTKRAKAFDEPRKRSVSPVLLLLPLIGVVLFSLAQCSGQMFDTGAMPQPDPGADSSQKMMYAIDHFSHLMLYKVFPVAIAVAGVIAVLVLPSRAKRLSKENDAFNETFVEPILRRYAEIQYCENCATLFDNSGHAVSGDQEGFAYLMSLAQDEKTEKSADAST